MKHREVKANKKKKRKNKEIKWNLGNSCHEWKWNESQGMKWN